MKTTCVNIRVEPYDVYIGRAGASGDGYFGNPFEIGRDGSRRQVLDRYVDWFDARVQSDAEFVHRLMELRGKRLGCFCKPAQCHGDVIAGWVNERAAIEAALTPPGDGGSHG